MGIALKGITRSRFFNTSPLQPPSPEQIRSAINNQFCERFESSKGNAIRHGGIANRFQGSQAIKRWQRGEIDQRIRNAIEQPRDDARQAFGISDPSVSSHERNRP